MMSNGLIDTDVQRHTRRLWFTVGGRGSSSTSAHTGERMHTALFTAASLGLALALAFGVPAHAAEIKVIAGGPFAAAFKELGPQFERDTGHKLVTRIAATAVVKREIDAGEAFDLAVSATSMIDEWINEGKIVADTRTTVALSGLGLAVRAGTPKPQIETLEQFRVALLNAKSVAHNAQSASAADFSAMLQRLGIAEEMKSKLKPIRSGAVPDAVLSGEAESGIATIPTILSTSGVEFAGPLPSPLQTYVSFSAGVGTAAREPAGARALIQFLRSPAAVAVIKAKGLEAGFR